MEFKYPEDVDKAVHKLDGLQMDGRTLRLDKAPEYNADNKRNNGGNEGPSGYYSDHSTEQRNHSYSKPHYREPQYKKHYEDSYMEERESRGNRGGQRDRYSPAGGRQANHYQR